MNADGMWNITVDTPMGKTEAVLALETDGGRVTGTSTSEGTTHTVEDGRIEGGRMLFSVKVRKPIPVRLKFDLGVDGDALAGRVKVGVFSTCTVTGARL